MKTSIHPAKIERVGEFSESQFGISNSEDLVYIFDILRNKLYSDKIMAVIREYSTNAMDAHVESGKPDLPIDISLPTAFSPSFKVRDYGQGLSEEDVRNVYCMYGRSTKRNSNDFTGQLGLGSKSGFSYGESFLITSYHKGLKTTYNAYIDETRIGSLAKMSQETIDPGETGIEICIPVSSGDCSRFRSTTEDTLKYFEVHPNILGEKDFFEDSVSEKIVSAGTWDMIKSSGYSYSSVSSTAIMGNIGYPIDWDKILNCPQETKDILHLDLSIKFPIGHLNIGANREALEYDKYTSTNIIKAATLIRDEFIEIIQEKLKECKTALEARILVASTYNNYKAQKVFGKKPVIWKGINVSDPYIKKDKHQVNFTRIYNRGTKTKREDNDAIHVSSNQAYALKDTSNGWVIRSKAYLSKNEKVENLIVISGDPQEIKRWAKSNGFTSSELIKLSTIEKPTKQKSKKPISPKDSAKAFTIRNHLNSWDPQGENWEPSHIDKKGKGVYVELYRFEIINEGHAVTSASNLKRAMKELKKANLDKDDITVYGIKASEVDKLGGGWVSLSNHVKNKIKESEEFSEMVQNISNRDKIRSIIRGSEIYNRSMKGVIKEAASKDLSPLISEMIKILKESKDKFHYSEDEVKSVQTIIGVFDLDKSECETKDLERVKELVNEIEERYPLLSRMQNYTVYNCRPGEHERFIEETTTYITLIENSINNKGK